MAVARLPRRRGRHVATVVDQPLSTPEKEATEAESDDATFAAERLAQNLARLGFAVWIGVVTHALHIAAFVATASATEGPAHVAWRRAVLALHAITLAFDLALAAALRLGARAASVIRRAPLAFALAYLALGAGLAGADQAITNDISPWMLVVIGVSLLLRLETRAAMGALSLGYALFLGWQHAGQSDARVLLSNSVKGLSIGALGLGLTIAFGRAQRREYDQRRIIERQRAGLEDALADATRAAAEAERANRDKTSFLAVMAHEIRTPMTGVLGVTDLLAKTHLDANQRQLLGTVQEAGRSLVALINDLLDISKAEAGRFAVDWVAADVSRELDAVAQLFEPKARSKGLALSIEWTSAPPPPLLCDPLRLRQMVSNLVGNAVRATSRGAVTVRADAALTDDRYELSVAIADTGPGIAPDVLAQLFTPYVQGDKRAAQGGSGLGLVISRQIAEAMGGHIDAESALGRGSTFTLRLSLRAATEAERARVTLSSAPPPSAHVGAVLVADDNAINRLVLREMLRQLGLEVELVGDGAGALAMLDARRFDAVLTDLQMPGIDGVELLRRVRAREAGAERVPMLVISAAVTEAERAKCFDAGADAVLLKPIRIKDLSAALAPFVSLSSTE